MSSVRYTTIAKFTLVALVLSTGAWLRLHHARLRVVPRGDEGSWMQVASNVARGNGFVSRVKEHFHPENVEVLHPSDARHPGFVYLLAAVFRFGGFDFHNATILVAVLGIIHLVLLWFYMRRRLSFGVCLLGLVLLTFSPFHVALSSSVYSEALFGIWFVVLATGDQWSRGRSLAGRAVLLGALAAAGYLVRPNGILFLPGGMLAIALRGRGWRERLMGTALFVGSFLLPAGPWLVRNMWHFGDPFYTWGSLMTWAGDIRDVYAIRDGFPTAATLIDQEGIVGVLLRPVTGMYRTLHYIDFHEEGMFYIVLPLALVRAVRTPFSSITRDGVFMVGGIVLTVLAIAWLAPICDIGRYAFFMVPFVYIAGAAEAMRLAHSLGPLRGPVASVAVGVVLCLPLIEPTRFYLRRAESRSGSPAADVRGAMRWIEENTPPDAVVMSHSLSQSAFSTQRRFMEVPWNRGVDTVLNVIDRFDVRYVVVGPRDRGNRPWVDSCWAPGSQALTEKQLPGCLDRAFTIGSLRGYRVNPPCAGTFPREDE